MASTSCRESADELLRQCLAGEDWSVELVDHLVEGHCSEALFGILIEGLADRFEPRLCAVYTQIFSYVLERVLGSHRSGDLLARYECIRQPRVCKADPDRVIVLSRVTLGADIAVTSVLLDAVKQRFPRAQILLAGSAKAAELFAADERVGHIPLSYPRAGSLAARLAPWHDMVFEDPAAIVIDPDSRLTQLGLLRVCDDDRYFFFESRAFGGESDAALTDLTSRWARHVFEVDECKAYVAPSPEPINMVPRTVSLSLGVGANPAKQMPENFEAWLVATAAERFRTVIADEGLGLHEHTRVHKAISGTEARGWSGSFASFCSVIAQSDAYIGYDSAGQHAAAALGVPLLTLFKGAPCDRMFHRWKPTGSGPICVLRDDAVTAASVESAVVWLSQRP